MPSFTLYLVSNADGKSLATLAPAKGDTVVETFQGYKDGDVRTLLIKGTLDPRTSGDDLRTADGAFGDLLTEQWSPPVDGDRWRTASVVWTKGPARFHRWDSGGHSVEDGYGQSPVNVENTP